MQMRFDLMQRLSHNAQLYFIKGARGWGKTYSFKKWCIDDFLKNGNQFIYLRRYKSEISNALTTLFFSDISDQYPEHKFTNKGGIFYIDGKIFGYALALTQYLHIKGTPFPSVTKICFDEYCIENKSILRYIGGEVEKLLDIINSVFRDRKIAVVCFANSLQQFDIYASYFGIFVNANNRVQKSINKKVYFEYAESAEYTEYMQNKPIGELTAGTEYGQYAFENKFFDTDTRFIEHKTGKSKHAFNIIINAAKYGVWLDHNGGKVYISKDIDNTCPNNYALTTSDMQPNFLLFSAHKNCYHFKILRAALATGTLYYECQELKNKINDIMRII